LHADTGGEAAKPASKMIDWNAGTLTDLIAILSAPAVSARVEVIPVGAEAPIGEVHLVAGGVSDSIYSGQATDDALDKLLTVTPARFRVDPRLPNPMTGELGSPGPESGTLDGRPLAHLMRYCEDYVITCSIEVWRGNETARVDYRRGEISGVTVGGIDAPERLAEVMQWASGNYRIILPAINLSASAPRRTTATAMPIAAASSASRGSATKTIFGIPQSEIAAARAAAEAIMQAQGVGTPQPPEVAPPPSAAPPPIAAPSPVVVATPVAAPAPAAYPTSSPIAPFPAPPLSAPIAPPGVAPSAVPAPLATSRPSATKTMFGVPAPSLPEGFATLSSAAPAAAAPEREPAAPTEPAPAESETARTDRIKTGARKVAVPAPEIVPPRAAAAAHEDVGRKTHFGFEGGDDAIKKTVEEKLQKLAKAEKADRAEKADKEKADRNDRTAPTRAPAAGGAQKQAPIWTYVGVGFTFGLVLLGVYHLVERLAH